MRPPSHGPKSGGQKRSQGEKCSAGVHLLPSFLCNAEEGCRCETRASPRRDGVSYARATTYHLLADAKAVTAVAEPASTHFAYCFFGRSRETLAFERACRRGRHCRGSSDCFEFFKHSATAQCALVEMCSLLGGSPRRNDNKMSGSPSDAAPSRQKHT